MDAATVVIDWGVLHVEQIAQVQVGGRVIPVRPGTCSLLRQVTVSDSRADGLSLPLYWMLKFTLLDHHIMLVDLNRVEALVYRPEEPA